MPGQDIRRAYMRKFVGLDKHPRPVAVAIVGAYTLQIVAAVAAGHWLLQGETTLWRGIAMAAIMLFIGTRLRGFNNIVHECSHATFAEKREDNARLGSFCASMIMGCFRDYRDDHMTHHAHLGDYEMDMDLHGIRALRLEAPLTPVSLLRHAVTPVLGLHFPYYLRINLSARDGAGYRALKLSLIVGTVVLALVAPLTALLFILVPWLWVFTAINYWTDCIDHGGILESGDELSASRNVPVPLALRVLLFPRNDCFHLVHHLFPQIPARHLEACHRELMVDPEYAAHANPERFPEPAFAAE